MSKWMINDSMSFGKLYRLWTGKSRYMIDIDKVNAFLSQHSFENVETECQEKIISLAVPFMHQGVSAYVNLQMSYKQAQQTIAELTKTIHNAKNEVRLAQMPRNSDKRYDPNGQP